MPHCSPARRSERGALLHPRRGHGVAIRDVENLCMRGDAGAAKFANRLIKVLSVTVRQRQDRAFAAECSAMARPIPRAPPVTNTCLPSRPGVRNLNIEISPGRACALS